MTELITFKELHEQVPVSQRTLRHVIAQLGYTNNRKRLIFTPDQVNEIKAAIVVRQTAPRYISAEERQLEALRANFGSEVAMDPATRRRYRRLQTKLVGQSVSESRKRIQPPSYPERAEAAGTTRLVTLKELLEEVPISECTLRQVVKNMGYTSRGKRLLFTEAQVTRIKEELACAYDHNRDITPLLNRLHETILDMNAIRRIKTQRTRRLRNNVGSASTTGPPGYWKKHWSYRER